VSAATAARDETQLGFFSWLSAIDWSKEVAVGEPVEAVDDLEERYEVVCRLSSPVDETAVILSTTLSKDDAVLDSLVPVYAGAAWHERECAEMFGIDFRGHPNLIKLYLPQEFEGYPLRKSFSLGAREVKPWPGHVDVEELPSTENVEASAQSAEDGEES
jgi:NADH-quinone oxidoreductase subunit C